MGYSVQHCLAHRLHTLLCNILILGNKGCTRAYSTFQYLDCAIIWSSSPCHFPFVHEHLNLFWYMNIYMITIREDSLIRVGVQYLPLTIGGGAMAFVAAWLVARLPAQVIICAGCLATLGCNLLLATSPLNLTYWAMGFPALLLSAFTIDLIVTSAQIITNNSVPVQYQGVAGSLVGTLLSYGMSTGLGFAGTVEVNTFGAGQTKEELLRGYHMAAYLGVGLAVVALMMSAVFIRIPKDTREGWDDARDMPVQGSTA
jgi:hypothetical protein